MELGRGRGIKQTLDTDDPQEQVIAEQTEAVPADTTLNDYMLVRGREKE